MSHSQINIDNVVRTLLTILSYRRLNSCGQTINTQRLRELFETIIPYYNVPGQYVYYPPFIQPGKVQHSWRDIFSQAIVNNYYRGRLNTDVDSIVGKAIWNRIRRHTGISDPCPYWFQVEAIVTAFNTLDTIRGALRSGNPRALQSFIPNPSTVAVLAPTGGGKTEIFEALILQLALDAHRGRLDAFTKAIIIYPMKAFMIEHFRRFVEDITYINAQIGTRLSIGILDGDTPDSLSTNDVLNRLSYVLGSAQCPLCGFPLRVRGQAPYYMIECSSNSSHRLNVRIAKDMIFQHPPDILLTTIDSFNYVLLERNRHVLLGAPSRYTDPRKLPPLILALDEPHVYTGVFGSNASLIFRAFEYTVQEYARRLGIQQYKPLKIVTSATMPYADEFLARLFVEEPQNIRIITPITPSTTNYQVGQQRSKGFTMFLPLREIHGFGFENAVVEIVPLIAAILPRNYRKVLVFVDSVDFAERLKRYMEDYIRRGLPDYSACRHLFEPDVYNPSTGRFNHNAITVAVHTSYIPRQQRELIEEGIRRTPPQYNIVIATPTLELGIDIGDITVVVIAGLPPTPEKFAQRAGRAGRRNPGLVIVIGNDTSAVDRYYLSDYNRAIGYLQLSLGVALQPTYMLPLNPVNLESIRRFMGNITATYANIRNLLTISSLQGHNTGILNDYLTLTIDRVTSAFSRSNSTLLQNVASFASTTRGSLTRELMQRFQNLINKFGGSTISAFVAPGNARRLYFTGQIDFIPIIDNVRSSVRPIEVQYYTSVQPPPPNHKPLFSIEVDAQKALAYYGIRYIEPSNNPFHPFTLRLRDVQRRIKKDGVLYDINTLRGTLHYSSYSGVSYLFEVAGLFYSQLDALNNYNALRQSLDDFMRNVDIIRNTSLELDRELSRGLRSQGRYRITLKRIYNLTNAITAFLNVSNQQNPHIVEPLIFYLLSPGILGKSSKNTLHNMLRYHSHNSLAPLDYFEVIPRRGSGRIRRYWEFSKIPDIRCPQCKSNRIELIEYDRNNLRLRLKCLQCNTTFDFNGRSSQWFIDIIRTRPITYATVIRGDPTNRRRLPNSPFELIFYRNIYAMFGNVGFHVSSLNRGVGRFMRTLPLRGVAPSEQYILGFRYRTQALELRINWSMLTSLLSNKLVQQQIGNEYSSLVISIPQNFNVRNDFIIRVTHTLSHLLISFAPIHTGGNRWDINEYISFETDNQGNIVTSSITIFDSDEGGNGVSELIGYFIRDILSDAISEAARHYLRQRNALIRFLGEPGITLFSVWPICPYSNIALSRSLTLIFVQNLLGLSGIQRLTNISANQLSQFIPSL